MNVNVTTKYLL